MGCEKSECACGREAKYQCDHEIAPGKTCDKYLCGFCAAWARKKANINYCQEHKAEHDND